MSPYIIRALSLVGGLFVLGWIIVLISEWTSRRAIKPSCTED
jgi:hypothetical protein